jgi:hypothetical protein
MSHWSGGHIYVKRGQCTQVPQVSKAITAAGNLDAVTVRLVEGSKRTTGLSGRLEVLRNGMHRSMLAVSLLKQQQSAAAVLGPVWLCAAAGIWGAVAWFPEIDQYVAKVVCRQLGLANAEAYLLHRVNSYLRQPFTINSANPRTRGGQARSG